MYMIMMIQCISLKRKMLLFIKDILLQIDLSNIRSIQTGTLKKLKTSITFFSNLGEA